MMWCLVCIIFIYIILSDATKELVSALNDGSSTISASDVIDVNAEEGGADDIVTSMDKACTSYKLETGPDKTKLMTNNRGCFLREITIKKTRRVITRYWSDQKPNPALKSKTVNN